MDWKCGFKFIRLGKGKPFLVNEIKFDNTEIRKYCALDFSNEVNATDFNVGSLLTHVNDICICTIATEFDLHNLISATAVSSIGFVNNIEQWEKTKQQAAKTNKITKNQQLPRVYIKSKQTLSLELNGFSAKGHQNRRAVLTAVTENFKLIHSVDIGDILVSVNDINTTELSCLALEDMLAAGVATFEVSKKSLIQHNTALARRSYETARYNSVYQQIRQCWDYAHPCAYCGYVYLESEKARSQCCMNGRALDELYFPQLEVMPLQLFTLATTRIEHMSSNSTYYNNVLALGATGVDNGAGGGFEKMVGDHAIKLNGRTYHFLPKTGGSGGLQYFTFDAMQSSLSSIALFCS
jgi:hypothetical protein